MPNLSDLLHTGSTLLHAANIEPAATEARILCAAVLALDRVTLLAQPERSLTADEATRLLTAFQRRAAQEPLARIVGRREFWSLDFALNAATLVPRPDSETLIATALTLFPDKQQPLRILDLGTGSGCLLLALLHEYPHATGLGIDRAAAACTQAQANAVALHLDQRAVFKIGDWHAADFSAQCAPYKFDLIMSNPPYIASAVIPTLDYEVRAHDPLAALDGGADGLVAYRQLAALLPSLSHAHTKALFEIGYDQANSVPAIFSACGHTVNGVQHDLAGQPRCVIVSPAYHHESGQHE